MSSLYVRRVFQWFAFALLVVACMAVSFLLSLYEVPWQGPNTPPLPTPIEASP